MSINRKRLGALLCVVAVGIAVASTAGAARQSTPGVTPSNVKIGGTFPLSGPASLYATIAGAEQAYYGWVNAHGGVNGRTITDVVRDDQYNPAKTVPAVKKLVETDHVFAIVGSLGTAPGLSSWNYLNNKKVPQVLLATGDSYWGTCTATGSAFRAKPYCSKPKPWTMGWQPTYPGEARLYAKYIIAHKPTAHIGVLRQDDAYGQNYLDAFTKALGSHKHQIVDVEQYNVTDSAAVVGGHVAALKAHGADTVALFSTPSASVTALATMGGALHWTPLTFLNNVSANRIFLLSAEGHGATPNGVISSSYIKSQTVTPGDSGMQLAKQIIYATGDGTLIGPFRHRRQQPGLRACGRLDVRRCVEALRCQPDAHEPHARDADAQRVGREQEPVRLSGYVRQDQFGADVPDGTADPPEVELDHPRLEDVRRRGQQRLLDRSLCCLRGGASAPPRRF